jgi:putative transposase
MLWGVVHKQVNVAVSTFQLHQFCLEVDADLREDGTESLESVSVQDPIAILCDEDQMDMKLKYAMSTVPDFT